MVVAPWDKIGLREYWMGLGGIEWYSMVFNGMVLGRQAGLLGPRALTLSTQVE